MKELLQRKTTNRPIVLFAIIMAMFMAAVEATIVATAMPGIVSDLGGFSLFTWVFGGYLLMQVVSIPIYGKLADLFGRKIIFSIGIFIFLVGSIWCGFATSMEWLIIARFIQGLGAGAVQPIATTIVGDIYTKEERASIQGYLASIWGISSILGPVLGGVFVQYLHWSWIFWMNIPFGILAVLLVVLFLKENVEKTRPAVDYFGALLILISVGSLMMVLIQGGVQWDWLSLPVLLCISLFGISFIAFIYQEKRAQEPIMSMDIWGTPLIVIANIASFASGALLLAVSSFLPTYVQGVMNQPAMIAGFTLTMISIGWPISSTIAGKLLLKIGYRKAALIGGFALVLGSTFYLTLSIVHHPVWAGLGSFFIGVGMGFSTTTFIVSIQSHVDWKKRGVATASNMFMRTLGGAVGVALLGGILNSKLKSQLEGVVGTIDYEIDMDIVNIILSPEQRKVLTEQEVVFIQEALSQALSYVYWGIFIFALISLTLIFFLPQDEKVNEN
ncbi:MDR family MFS transporter [Alkalihalobacterium chitinilyticum]|uniref:MFS transporter n=1 Tax=Alkalihalobacterium chitinilyticum TaxID=2980103 RepID=A0ABT5VH31_9BACI|nr:MDR family MFS transporter [Alkalihalobacterium chitinilyticum]MDE5413758.1 MFS transporter [Alkalihalobacterium chitinilyticum]